MPLAVPADLEEALAAAPAARDAFASLPPERKDAWISWIQGGRGPARRRRIQYAIQKLGGYRPAAAAATSETVAEPVYPLPPEREWWPWVLLGLLALAGLAALLIWLFVFRDNDHHKNTVVTQRTTVPSVVGLKQDAAVAALRKAKLGSAIVKTNSTQPQGTVVHEVPPGDTRVPTGTKVKLTVSSGPLGVAVPSTVGLSAADATKKLTAANLTAQIVQVASKKAPGTVVSQKPAAGAKAPPGSTVTLAVSKGTTTTTTTTTVTTTATTTTTTTTTAPGTVTVPTLVGQKLASALGALERANLRASLKYLPSQKPLGTVIGQNPAPGKKVPTRTRVQVNAAEGPNAGNPAQVPDVAGQDQQTATTALQNAGFQVIVIKRTGAPTGTVVEQQPAAGTTLATGDFVAIYVGR